jgi:WD40 repeat protein
MSGSYNKTVWLWDTATGALLQTLEGHSGYVNSVAFSSDSKLLQTLLVSNNWITDGATNILWLPPDYRTPTCVAIWNGILVLGYSLGRISIVGFKEGLKVI